MARDVDPAEAERRLDFYLDLDARLIREPNPLRNAALRGQ